MQNAAWLLVVSGVDLLALEPGQRLEHAAGQVGRDEKGHPGGDQRVAAEDGHEPRRPGRHHHSLGEVGVEDAQGAEILGAAVDDLLQPRVIGLDLRDPSAPLLEPLGGRGPPRVAAPPVLGSQDGAVDDRCDLQRGAPLATGGDDHMEGGEVRAQLGVVPDDDLDAAGHPASPVAVDDDRWSSRPVFGDDGRDVTGRLGSGPAFLDGEEVGEVRPDEHLDHAGGCLVGEVPHRDLLEHAPTDRTRPEHHERGVGHPGGGQAPRDEGGGERVVGDRRQRLGGRPVHEDLEAADQARVPKEEALGTAGDDVPRRAADGKG